MQGITTSSHTYHHHPRQYHSPKPPPPAPTSSATRYHYCYVAVPTQVPWRRDAAWERSSPTNVLFESAIPGKRRLRQGKRESTWKGVFKKCASFITNATVSLADHHQILMVHLLYPLPAHSWRRIEKLCWLLPGPQLPPVNVSSMAHLFPSPSEMCSLVSPCNLWRSQHFWRSRAQQSVSHDAVLSSRFLQL